MRWIQGMAVGALSLALAACSSSPTGRQQLTLVSDQQLNQMGAQTFEQYQQELPTVGGATLNYVQCVSNAIVAELPSSNLAPSWQVKVFDDPSANAFALPGGYIGVNTGLLEIASNQDQLAAVIGHEVSHVLARHANERVSTQQATQLGLSVIQSAAGIQGPQGDAIMGALGAGAQYGIMLPFSRSHESEADTLGIQLMADAGFDPRASVTLWEKMSQAGGGQPPVWMSTHPSNNQRISGLEASMNEALPRYQQARQSGKTPNCSRS
ncbi:MULTISPECIES: M48 family metallopeptidase [Halomonadaceae]|uniref:Peptidase M48-like protein n=1 Tax=Onishia taeanensis TaxID=284577 RepID=A0A328XMB8_9GAMM|nr:MULTISPECIES: M48 family metallopeptidase [Halomonas]RAR60932.1 peptidase M48-like protein [Halomonas taeanensis]